MAGFAQPSGLNWDPEGGGPRGCLYIADSESSSVRRYSRVHKTWTEHMGLRGEDPEAASTSLIVRESSLPLSHEVALIF